MSAMQEKPRLKITRKPCGDCWLHINAPSGLRASINLGQCGSMNDQTIFGRVIQEVAETESGDAMQRGDN